MDKTSRIELMKALMAKKKTDKKLCTVSSNKKEPNFIAYVDPTESDVLDELTRMDSFKSRLS